VIISWKGEVVCGVEGKPTSAISFVHLSLLKKSLSQGHFSLLLLQILIFFAILENTDLSSETVLDGQVSDVTCPY